jgi:hypothetical protein
MTAAELHDAAARLVGQRIEQGLGERVDGATLARIVSLLVTSTREATKTPGFLDPSVFVNSVEGGGDAPASTTA